MQDDTETRGADVRIATVLLSVGRSARGFGFCVGVRGREQGSSLRAPCGKVGNRCLVFHFSIRGDAGRWKCGNLAALARFPRGGGGSGGNLFLVFPAFHGPVISTALLRPLHRYRGATGDSVLQSRSSRALEVAILRAHSVSLICIARYSNSAKLRFCFKCLAASGMDFNFSYGVR